MMVEAGLVIVFEGVLDATSKVNATFQSLRLRCVPIYILLCMYQGERLALGEEES